MLKVAGCKFCKCWLRCGMSHSERAAEDSQEACTEQLATFDPENSRVNLQRLPASSFPNSSSLPHIPRATHPFYASPHPKDAQKDPQTSRNDHPRTYPSAALPDLLLCSTPSEMSHRRLSHHRAARWHRSAGLRRHHSHLRALVSKHQHMPSDLQFGMCDFGAVRIIHPHHFLRAKNILIKLNRLGCIRDDETWNQRIILFGNGFCAHKFGLDFHLRLHRLVWQSISTQLLFQIARPIASAHSGRN